MAWSCRTQAERIEEKVIQPVDKWVDQQERRCRDEPCKWWMFCLNKLVCWLVVVLVKITVWITTIVVRWVYTTVCTLVSVVIGIGALVIGRFDILAQAVKDLWTLAKDAFYAATGTIIFGALRAVDFVQTLFELQPTKRGLTEHERELLRPIFRE